MIGAARWGGADPSRGQDADPGSAIFRCWAAFIESGVTFPAAAIALVFRPPPTTRSAPFISASKPCFATSAGSSLSPRPRACRAGKPGRVDAGVLGRGENIEAVLGELAGKRFPALQTAPPLAAPLLYTLDHTGLRLALG